MTEIFPCCPIEQGQKIEKANRAIYDVCKNFTLASNYKNIIYRYFLSDKPIALIIPACAPRNDDLNIHNINSQIILPTLPQEINVLKPSIQALIQILENYSMNYILEFYIGRPRHGQIELLEECSPEAINDIDIAYKCQELEIKKIFGEKIGFQILTKDFSDLGSKELEYRDYLLSLYESNRRFKEFIDRKIKNDKVKLRKGFERRKRFILAYNKDFDALCIEIVISHIADSMAFGDILVNSEINRFNPIVFSSLNRDNPINLRNKLRLPKYGRIEQPTIPILT